MGFSTTQPIIDEEYEALCNWLKSRENWRESDSEWYFYHKKRGPISRQQVYGLLRRLGKKPMFLLVHTLIYVTPRL